MDSSLAASDRSHSGRRLHPTFDELCQNTRLLIGLRWVAGLSILASTMFAWAVLDISLKTLPLLFVGCAVLVYNSILYNLFNREKKTRQHVWRVTWVQVILDWAAMTVLVYLTGGITSPALIYFVIHAALSGTILVRWQVRSLAGLAILLVGLLAVLGRSGWLPHINIPELGLDNDLYKNTTYIAAVLFFFGTTIITLSELVTDRAQRLRQREQRIQHLYEARSAFMRIATHELRAPLAAGLSLMRNIEQGYTGELSPQQAAIITRVTGRLEGLTVLVDDLLALATSQEATIAQVPLERVSLRAVLEHIIERESPSAEAKRITLNTDLADDAGMTMAAASGLYIIFGNLLNNAIKYTPDGGRVDVLYRIAPSDRQAIVSITDTGMGIPAEDMPRVFDEFYRASNVKNAHIAGTGIGLPAVRMLVERFGSTINLESEEGKGTTVQVTLPLAARHSVVF
ncbi:MAG: HAMP domain-containing histidine kinase [Anaerolineae bacterium]|nr:HAMP domain-containing histidine kinase [Anaerolineae bacterium]